jgi:hypothetical protein
MQEQNKTARLPCRGCLKDCPNYQRCGGYPWRNLGSAKSSNDSARVAINGEEKR